MKTKESIDSNLLIQCGAAYKKYNKGEYIFHEGQLPRYYYQIAKGKVKMVSETEGDKAFIQGFFSAGQSFGEPPIFINKPYPASAIAEQASLIIRLSVSSFTQLLKNNFDVHWKMTQVLASRTEAKANSLKEISCYTPEHRILTVLQRFRNQALHGARSDERIKIDYTRQEIAGMTALRVETVIRVMRNLRDRNILTIEKGKVFY